MVFDGPGRPHRAVAVEPGPPGAGELHVAIEFATVCGSDVHTALGHRDEPTPLVLGHEAVGRVVAAGSEAPASVGDRVVWSVAVHCGDCDRCARGIPQKCRRLRKYGHSEFSDDWPLSGGFATHARLLPGTPVVVVGEELPAAVLAPAGCGIATAWAALAAAERIRPLAGADVLVTGGGLIGLAATAMAVERGARVTVSDPDSERRELARRFGAASAIDPRDPVRDSPAGRPPGSPAALDGFDIVLDASGAPGAVAAGLAAVATGGTVVWAGSVFPTDPVPIVPERIVRGLVTIAGVHNYAPSDLEGAVRFLQRHGRRLPFAELVGEVFPLERIDAALVRAAERREIRVGVVPASR